jgi:hypothetical protein
MQWAGYNCLHVTKKIRKGNEEDVRGWTGVNRLVYVHVIEQSGPSAHSLGHLERRCSDILVSEA